MNSPAKLIVWQVWCLGAMDQFFGSKHDAEAYIRSVYGDLHLHPDDHGHAWTRENYGGMFHYPDGRDLWMGWTRRSAVHLERHEVEATSIALAQALNDLPKTRCQL